MAYSDYYVITQDYYDIHTVAKNRFLFQHFNYLLKFN